MKNSLRNLKIRMYWIHTFRQQWHRQRQNLLLLIVFKVLLILIGLATPFLFKLLIDQVMVNQELDKLWVVCIGYFVIYIAETAILGGQISIGNQFSNRLTFAIRTAVWNSYMRMPFQKYDQMSTGDLKARLDQDVESVDRLFRVQSLEYGYSYFSSFFGAVMMIWFSWKLALFGLLMVPLSFWITKRLSTGAQRVSVTYRDIYGKYEGWLQLTILGWREIKASRMEKRVSLKFTEYWHQISKVFFQKEMYWFGNRVLQEFKDLFITRMNLYFIGGILILHGEMTIGSLLVFMKYYEMMFTHLGVVNDLDMQFNGDVPGLEKVKAILADDSTGKKSEGSVPICTKDSSSSIINVKDLSFGYSEGSQHVLHNISFEIQAGTKVAIVGRSGSGKSTMVKLLLGMYEPMDGEILLGGQELRCINENELRRKMSVVMQDPAIFNMSILDNVKLAKPKASVAEVEEACRSSGMDDFIQKLPEKHLTIIGEKGVQLSGGQKQRLAMARLLLSNAQVIILDEATSMLDHETETGINQIFDKFSTERTVIVIAHRLSSVMRSDDIILLDEGSIADRGTHNELWRRNAVYRTIFNYNH